MEKKTLIRVLHIGNGEWYHGGSNPLQHEWVTIGNKAKCRVCHKHIELITLTDK